MRVRGCEVRGVEVERQFKFILHTAYTFIMLFARIQNRKSVIDRIVHTHTHTFLLTYVF